MEIFIKNIFKDLDIASLLDALKNQSGATYDLHQHKLVNDDTGFVLAVFGYGKEIRNFSLCANFLKSQLLIYLFNSNVLNKVKQDNRLKLGLWLNAGTLYIDLTENIPDIETARVEAANRKQKAIWDCANKHTILLN